MNTITLLGNPGVIEGRGGKKGNRRYYVKEVCDQTEAIVGGIYAVTGEITTLTSEARKKLGTIVIALDHQRDPEATYLIEQQSESGLRLHDLHAKVRKAMNDTFKRYQIEPEEVHVVLEQEAREIAKKILIDSTEMRCSRKTKRDMKGAVLPGCNATAAGYLLAAIQRNESHDAVQLQAFWQLDKDRVRLEDVAPGGRLAADILCRQKRPFILQNHFLSLHGEALHQGLGIRSDIFRSNQSGLVHEQHQPKILMTAEMLNG